MPRNLLQRRYIMNKILSDENTREGRHLTPEERIALQAEEIKQLWQENEQLRAQVARMREALIIANHRMPDVGQFCALCEALTAIDKAIGGKEI